MRLLHKAVVLELGEDVPHRGGRHTKPGGAGKHRRRDRLSRGDVFTHQCGEYPSGAIVRLH